MTSARLLILLSATLLGGCASLNPPKPGDTPAYRPAAPLEPRPATANNGAIYQPAVGMNLFEDQKAKRVGDLITVILSEKTDAKKSSSTSTKKDASDEANLGNITVLGKTLLSDSNAKLLGASSASKRAFDGSGDSSQSNQFSGQITVTVAEVLPNGNLVIQGEKWLGINQGNEYVRLRGIVRPADVTTTNTVKSTQIANAEIYYGGTGMLNDSNTAGWLTRFFNSPIWPI